MRRTLALATAVALIAVLGLASAALGGDRRPMEGHFTVAVVPVAQRCGPNALTIGFEGIGIATHLGRMTGTGSNCTEFSLGTGPVAIWDGTATFVAADGSTVTVGYVGTQAAPTAGVTTAITINTVVSGTGRFAGADGSWTTVGTIDLVNGVFNGQFSGWIGY